MKTLRIGIAGYDRMKAHTMALARGERKPTKGEPMIWFTSIESFAGVLSGRNRELLALIAREKPASLAELARRNKSNISRTLKTMSRYGLVEMKEGQRGTLVTRVPYDRVSLDVSLTSRSRVA